jgi:hypothetical protein
MHRTCDRRPRPTPSAVDASQPEGSPLDDRTGRKEGRSCHWTPECGDVSDWLAVRGQRKCRPAAYATWSLARTLAVSLRLGSGCVFSPPLGIRHPPGQTDVGGNAWWSGHLPARRTRGRAFSWASHRNDIEAHGSSASLGTDAPSLGAAQEVVWTDGRRIAREYLLSVSSGLT